MKFNILNLRYISVVSLPLLLAFGCSKSSPKAANVGGSQSTASSDDKKGSKLYSVVPVGFNADAPATSPSTTTGSVRAGEINTNSSVGSPSGNKLSDGAFLDFSDDVKSGVRAGFVEPDEGAVEAINKTPFAKAMGGKSTPEAESWGDSSTWYMSVSNQSRYTGGGSIFKYQDGENSLEVSFEDNVNNPNIPSKQLAFIVAAIDGMEDTGPVKKGDLLYCSGTSQNDFYPLRTILDVDATSYPADDLPNSILRKPFKYAYTITNLPTAQVKPAEFYMKLCERYGGGNSDGKLVNGFSEIINVAGGLFFGKFTAPPSQEVKEKKSSSSTISSDLSKIPQTFSDYFRSGAAFIVGYFSKILTPTTMTLLGTKLDKRDKKSDLRCRGMKLPPPQKLYKFKDGPSQVPEAEQTISSDTTFVTELDCVIVEIVYTASLNTTSVDSSLSFPCTQNDGYAQNVQAPNYCIGVNNRCIKTSKWPNVNNDIASNAFRFQKASNGNINFAELNLTFDTDINYLPGGGGQIPTAIPADGAVFVPWGFDECMYKTLDYISSSYPFPFGSPGAQTLANTKCQFKDIDQAFRKMLNFRVKYEASETIDDKEIAKVIDINGKDRIIPYAFEPEGGNPLAEEYVKFFNTIAPYFAYSDLDLISNGLEAGTGPNNSGYSSKCVGKGIRLNKPHDNPSNTKTVFSPLGADKGLRFFFKQAIFSTSDGGKNYQSNLQRNEPSGVPFMLYPAFPKDAFPKDLNVDKRYRPMGFGNSPSSYPNQVSYPSSSYKDLISDLKKLNIPSSPPSLGYIGGVILTHEPNTPNKDKEGNQVDICGYEYISFSQIFKR